MTKPTPAQIEAATKALEYYVGYNSDELARAALTAAAEVDEPSQKMADAATRMSVDSWIVGKAVEDTIERCAQVAEKHWIPGPYNTIPQDIAAAIRKLKEGK